MSEQHTETIRRIYERWSGGDFTGGIEYLDQHLAFVISPDFPDARAYFGVDALAEYMRGFLEPWDRLTIEATEIEAAGDHVIARVHQRGSGISSGIETELRYWHIWSFRGERIIRIENFMHREEVESVLGLAD